MKIKGYKAFREDMTCDPDPKNPFRYEVGKIYEMPDHPILCVRGFHFCGNVSDCYNFYPTTDRTPICEVEADGWLEFSKEARDTNGRNGKMVTNRITILRRLSHDEIQKAIEKEIEALSTPDLPVNAAVAELRYLMALLEPLPTMSANRGVFPPKPTQEVTNEEDCSVSD
jgi:hypothetical protein